MSATRAGVLSRSQIRAPTRSRPKYLPVCRLRMTISPARSEDTRSLVATTSELVRIAHGPLADDTTPPRCLRSAQQAPGAVAQVGGAGCGAPSRQAQRGGAARRDQRQAKLGTRGRVDEKSSAATDRMKSPDGGRRATPAAARQAKDAKAPAQRLGEVEGWQRFERARCAQPAGERRRGVEPAPRETG